MLIVVVITFFSNGIGSSSISSSSSVITNTPIEPPKSTYSAAPKKPTGTGMKLGGKKNDVSKFLGQLESEGVTVEEVNPNRKAAAAVKAAAVPDVDKER